MLYKQFCPLVNGQCRDDCVFRRTPVSGENGITVCLLADKLAEGCRLLEQLTAEREK